MRLTIKRVRAWHAKTERAAIILGSVGSDVSACYLAAKGSDYSRAADLRAAVRVALRAAEDLAAALDGAADTMERRAIAHEAGGHRQPVRLDAEPGRVESCPLCGGEVRQ